MRAQTQSTFRSVVISLSTVACYAAVAVAQQPAQTDSKVGKVKAALREASAKQPASPSRKPAQVQTVSDEGSPSQFRPHGVQPASMQPPSQPLDPTPAPLPSGVPFQPLDTGIGAAASYNFNFVPQPDNAPAYGNVIAGGAASLGASTDAVGGLEQAGDSLLNAQRRSPISLDPHIRGYRIGQIYTQADGAFYFPVRIDLDTVMSKFDPSLIENVVIVPGPYGIQYGPGFSFIDVQTFKAPRFNNGFEMHGRTGFDYRANGGQVFGRETVWGGSSDWGFIFTYGNRNGGDYSAGSGQKIPASYAAQNFNLQLGFDLTPDSHLEIRGTRLDQGHTEYALQFFDVNFLATDALTMNYVNDNPFIGTRLRADAWWNNTRFAGDTTNTGKQTFGPINRVDAALQSPPASLPGAQLYGNTQGNLVSVGGREVLSFGDKEEGEVQLDAGVDARLLTQNTVENFTIQNGPGANIGQGTPVGPVPQFSTNQPHSEMFDVGGFLDITLPWNDFCKSTIGYRFDWVHTTARASEVPAGSFLAPQVGSFPQDDVLNTYYLLNDLQVTDVWSVRFGGGHADRVPTLTDRYANGIFVGIIQNGFTRVFGDPNLAKESMWQLDTGVTADYDIVRGGFNFYYSWINDYITYRTNEVLDPTGARLLTAINTPLATLAGVNGHLEADWTTQATSYFTFQYVRGQDITIATPLAQIYPLDTRLGMRLKSSDDGNTWGLDGGLRMVASQNRFAIFRTNGNALQAVEQRTGGFTLGYVRGYYNVSQNLRLVGGVENAFNRQYLDHLALRLPFQPSGAIAATGAFSPGITPYAGIEWTY